MLERRQGTVTQFLEQQAQSLANLRTSGTGLLAQTGTTLTGQFLGAQAGERELNQLASGLRSQREMLEVNAQFEAASLRMQGFTALADLRERAIASPQSLFAMLSSLYQASTIPGIGRAGAFEVPQGVGA